MNPKSAYRVDEAAELCGCEPEVIMSAIKDGRLEAIALGGDSFQVKLQSLDKFHQARQGESLFPDLGSDAHEHTVNELFEVISDIASEDGAMEEFTSEFSHSGSR